MPTDAVASRFASYGIIITEVQIQVICHDSCVSVSTQKSHW